MTHFAKILTLILLCSFCGFAPAAEIQFRSAATAAGSLVVPMLATGNIDPNLMVLSIGAGSLMFSHVNDPGFWMFKEYFNVSIRDTIRSWSLMETIVAVAGLIGVLLLKMFI